MKPTFTLTLTNGYPAGNLNLTTEDNDAVCERAGDFVIKLPCCRARAMGTSWPWRSISPIGGRE